MPATFQLTSGYCGRFSFTHLHVKRLRQSRMDKINTLEFNPLTQRRPRETFHCLGPTFSYRSNWITTRTLAIPRSRKNARRSPWSRESRTENFPKSSAKSCSKKWPAWRSIFNSTTKNNKNVRRAKTFSSHFVIWLLECQKAHCDANVTVQPSAARFSL